LAFQSNTLDRENAKNAKIINDYLGVFMVGS